MMMHNKLHHISVQLLCFTDEPFQPLEAIPIKTAEQCIHVAIVVIVIFVSWKAGGPLPKTNIWVVYLMNF